MSKLDRLKESRANAPQTDIINRSYAELVKGVRKVGLGSSISLEAFIVGEDFPLLRSLNRDFPGSSVYNMEGQPVLHIKLQSK